MKLGMKTTKTVSLSWGEPISVAMLRRDLPPVRHQGKSVNSVLALHKRSIYDDTNTYIARWQVSNTVYYRKNRDQFEGWVDLVDYPVGYCPDNCLAVQKERRLSV